MAYHLSELINIARLQELLDSFQTISGVPTGIATSDGVFLTVSGLQNICTHFHRCCPVSAKMCCAIDIQLMQQMKPDTFTGCLCPNGLMVYAYPIMADSNCLAILFTGQFLLTQPDEEFFRRQARDYGFDEEAYLTELRKVPIVPVEQLTKILDFYERFGQLLADQALEKIRQQEAAIALSSSEERYRSLVRQSSDGVFIYDHQTKQLQEANERFMQMFGYHENDITSLTVYDLFEQPRETLDAKVQAIVQAGNLQSVPRQYKRKDGTSFAAESSSSVIHYGQNSVIMATVRDITARKEEEEHLRLAAVIFETTIGGILVANSSGKILSVNPAFTAITGYSAEEVIGQTPHILKSGRHNAAFYKEMWTSLCSNGSWQGKIQNRRKSGELFAAWLHIRSVGDDAGNTSLYVAVYSDLTARKRYEEKLRHQAYYDALTDLPNRLLFEDRLNLAISQAKRHRQQLAVMFLDLDGFKQVNDTLGHDAGDLLLLDVAHRLSAAVRASDTVTRLGGDEFAFILPEIRQKEHVSIIASKILAAFKTPFILFEKATEITCSIGISLYPMDGDDVPTLLKKSDTAMYNAKIQGKNQWKFYEETK